MVNESSDMGEIVFDKKKKNTLQGFIFFLRHAKQKIFNMIGI